MSGVICKEHKAIGDVSGYSLYNPLMQEKEKKIIC